MSDTLEVLIDLSQANLDLEPEALETYTRRLVEELKDGLAEEASLMRFTETPEGSKSGEAGFDLGILKAEVNLKNIKALLDWLGDRIYGRNLILEYGEVRLEYRNTQQLEQQLQALERIDKLKVRVVKSESE
ncbi:hypothetical protein H6G00_21140 [Leptolyngbya sp. FACHB-541]|uniref:hypothetical protein n=1 Tax=Leptolyngbya sp. FACHB-541 TaxID=2692810 RepID=UPI00168A358A|nr:hypothetical protein [Leptolyngbya sp. FACHB-541]MBD1999089.1 hypothetical protein [Leptolyngbya sp. FACHB-541]